MDNKKYVEKSSWLDAHDPDLNALMDVDEDHDIQSALKSSFESSVEEEDEEGFLQAALAEQFFEIPSSGVLEDEDDELNAALKLSAEEAGSSYQPSQKMDDCPPVQSEGQDVDVEMDFESEEIQAALHDSLKPSAEDSELETALLLSLTDFQHSGTTAINRTEGLHLCSVMLILSTVQLNNILFQMA